MRRTVLIVVATALVTSALTSFTVASAVGGSERKAAAPRDSYATGPKAPFIDLDTKVDCGTPPKGQNWKNQDLLEKSIRCLEDEVLNLNKFLKVFFRCARITEVTRYGDPTGGTFGYEFTNDGVSFFLTSALDYTTDPTTEDFSWMMLWQNTEFCTS